MKKPIYTFLSLLFVAIALTDCKKEEIVFPIEEPQFEVQEGKILIEIIAPTETSINTDILYIAGAFSGDKKLELTRAEYMDYKYGIYLDPADFKDGKTLADGYWFESKLQGKEVSAKDQLVTHNETSSPGERIDLSLSHWEMFYNNHNGYVVYVENKTTWKGLYLYGWAEGAPEIFGSWPGIPPTGEEEIDGVNYQYFDMQTSNTGTTYNLIFNGGSGQPQLADYTGYTIDHDIFFTITDDGWSEKGATVAKGHRIYALNHTGWLDMRLYVWGDGEFMGGWPGQKPLSSTIEVAGNTYSIYEFPAEANNKAVNLIFNSNDEKTNPESIKLTLNQDYYVQVVIDGGPKVIDPEGEIVKPDLPEGDMLIRANKPDSWENLFIQSNNYTNDWPGSLMNDDGDGWYSFSLPRGVTFVFVEAAFGNQTEYIAGIKDDTCFKIYDNGKSEIVNCK